jgi:hypothetical protein
MKDKMLLKRKDASCYKIIYNAWIYNFMSVLDALFLLKKLIGGLLIGAALIIGTAITAFTIKESATSNASTTTDSNSQQNIILTGSTGAPFTSVDVYKDGRYFTTIKADSKGIYGFSSNEPGTYTIKSQSGMQTATVQSDSKTNIYQKND